MRLVSRFLVVCLALAASPLFAEPLRTLYQVREPVPSQQADARGEALQRAFDTLLLRLTGDAASAGKPALAELRKDPQKLISRYGYEGDSLVVDFDPATTERTLRQAGLALWGANRPVVLAWWLSETANGTQLLGDAQDGATALQAAARHRGLPLRLPLADLQEQLAATPETLGAADAQALREPSERYAADALLTVHAREGEEGWQARWNLWLNDAHGSGQAKGDSQAAVADAVMLAVSQYLAPRYVVAPGAAKELTLEVLGADITRFAELDKLLQPLGGKLLSVERDRLVYRVTASPEQLRAQLELARLQEVPAEPAPLDGNAAPVAPDQPQAAQPEPDTVLRYRW
ncbi:DUF2066 domain-containing protein [Pseudomonas phenolilytica]|uniref:DUF2066 domain-containing protein n=1 Tax=Pseudomonas phenolilytica TaxID=2746321 RepID=UPI001F15A6B0|nr:DUF2066 domain-containing protein [Pseudomonas phenolilytica]UIP87033.1 DUF2066 domain-containing protein [Pseudomonas phenolilytica]